MTRRYTDELISQYEDRTGPASDINVGKTERAASVLGGGLLALLAVRLRKWISLGLAPLAGELVYRGVTGHSYIYDLLGINRAVNSKSADVSVPHEQGIRVEKSVTINRSPEVIYIYWRNFENLPRFMEHLDSVRVIDSKHSHWVAKAPLNRTVDWDAEIVNEIENELIAWRSLDKADVDNAGTVQFKRAPGDRGTEVHVVMEYAPLAGQVGSWIARLLGEEPHQQVESDLRRLKQLLEAGEVPTNDGQPSGRKEAWEKAEQLTASDFMHTRRRNVVEEASEQSFPASDSPSWSGTGL